MKKKILLLLACLILPLQLVQADIGADMKAGLSIKTVIEKALAEGSSIADVVSELVALDLSKAGDIVAVAISVSPDQSEAITTAAILAGADPTQVTTASAAGSASAGGGGFGGGGGASSGSGSGGGGVASPS